MDLANQCRWHHLAVSYDSCSGETVQYFDGRRSESRDQPAAPSGRSIKFGYCEIGNWGLPTPHHAFPIRNLNGCIDEFLIYKAVFSPEEIHALFESGKPE